MDQCRLEAIVKPERRGQPSTIFMHVEIYFGRMVKGPNTLKAFLPISPTQLSITYRRRKRKQRTVSHNKLVAQRDILNFLPGPEG
jgi:hypothetical protein